MRPKRILYWYKPRQCWRKTKRSEGKQKTWYFQHPKNEAGYQAALEEWEAIDAEGKKVEELAQARVHAHEDIRLLDRAIEFHQLEGNTTQEKALSAWRDKLVADYLEKIGRNESIKGGLAQLFELRGQIETIIVRALTGQLDQPVPPEGVELSCDGFDFDSMAIEEAAEHIEKLVMNPPVLMDKNPRAYAVAKHKEWSGQSDPPSEKQVSKIQKDFIETKKTTDISPKTLNAIAAQLEHFVSWLADKHITDIENLNGKWLTKYREHLVDQADSGDIARVTARKRLVTARTFIRWAYQNDYTNDLPRNIDSRALSISINDFVPKHFTVVEIKRLLKTAQEINDLSELLILLSLNCGMLPKDISDLHPDEVDWTKGTITRKRSKTGKKKAANRNSKVPTVTYKLWKRTFELLKKHRSTNNTHVFVTANDLPLCREELTGDGTKVRETNNVLLRFCYVVTKLPKKLPKGKSFKTLRATGASKLEEHETHGRFTGLYLGHAPDSIKDKHYAAPPQKLFDEAITWLGKQFGME
jgi:integrase